ncbi:MAG TPA: HNH endonuclease signature motif containing protein [Gaiellales bacterium]|nr:HNH endonuclease signature motif containing protein [Gaiellales bacterium]
MNGKGRLWPSGRRRWTSKQRRRLIDELLARDGDLCPLCGLPLDLSLGARHPNGVTFDHIIRVADGGGDDLDNLQLAHRPCNTRRGHEEERLANISDDLDALALGILDLGEAGA